MCFLSLPSRNYRAVKVLEMSATPHIAAQGRFSGTKWHVLRRRLGADHAPICWQGHVRALRLHKPYGYGNARPQVSPSAKTLHRSYGTILHRSGKKRKAVSRRVEDFSAPPPTNSCLIFALANFAEPSLPSLQLSLHSFFVIIRTSFSLSLSLASSSPFSQYLELCQYTVIVQPRQCISTLTETRVPPSLSGKAVIH